MPNPGSRRLFVLLGCLAAAGPGAMDLYLPALPTVAADLRSSTSGVQLTVALYLAGLALGQLVFGQISDVYGRRRPLLIGLVVFVLASVACAATSTVWALCAGRLLQGIGGASGMVIGRAVVRDLYGVTESARYYSRLTLIYGLAPLVAPLIGSQVLRVTSWNGVFLVTGALGVLLLAAATAWFGETLPRERRQPGTYRATLATFGSLLRTRRFVGCTLTTAVVMGVLVAYLSSSPFIIQDRYGASPLLFATLFSINALAMIVGNQINAHLLHTRTPLALAAFGLGLLITAASGLMIVAIAGLGLVFLELCLVALLASWGFVQANILALGLADLAAVAGAGSALIGLAQFMTGAVFGPIAGVAGSEAIYPFAAIALGCGSVGAVCAYFLVFRGAGGTPAGPVEPLDVV